MIYLFIAFQFHFSTFTTILTIILSLLLIICQVINVEDLLLTYYLVDFVSIIFLIKLKGRVVDHNFTNMYYQCTMGNSLELGQESNFRFLCYHYDS